MMKRFTLWPLLLGTVLCLGAITAQSEVASGDYSLSFDGNVAIWDISGSYSEDLDDMAMHFTINVDPTGKFAGTGYVDYQIGWDSLYADLTFSGTIKSAGNVVRVGMTMKMDGSGHVEGYDVKFKATAKETLEIDTASQYMVGTISGKVSVEVPGVGKASQPIPTTTMETRLPEDMDGGWDLTLHVAPTGTKYAGTAAVELSNERVIPFALSGAYSAKKNSTKLSLKGIDLNRCMSLSLAAAVTNAQFRVQSGKGKVLGQSITLQP
jgi:hypothetical protein